MPALALNLLRVHACATFGVLLVLPRATMHGKKGQLRTFKIGNLSSNVVVMLPGTLTLAGCFSFWLQMPPYLGQLWWNFYLQLTVSIVLCGVVVCAQPRGMG